MTPTDKIKLTNMIDQGVNNTLASLDVTNPEAWNLKGLVHYEQKKYAQALDAVNKAIESDKTYGMAWYNKACFLSLLNQVPESLQALKHSIEIPETQVLLLIM